MDGSADLASPPILLAGTPPAVQRCAQCYLPLGTHPLRLTIDSRAAGFCCYGCYLVLQVTRERGAAGQAQGVLLRLGLALFFSMNAMMFTLPAYFPFVYGTPAAAGGFVTLLRVAALAFTIPVLVLLGLPLLWQAARDAARLILQADALIALGATASFAVSVHNVIVGAPEIYFDSGAMLLVLVTLGRYLEARAKSDSASALDAALASLPLSVLVERDGQAVETAREALRCSDVVRLRPGEASPVDGIVEGGESTADESSLTGESQPVRKLPGSTIIAGSVNLDGILRVRATRVGADSTAGRLARAVEDALATKTPIQRTADRIATAFTPAVIGLALATFAYWSARAGIDRGVVIALSVLVVSCPCALGIATPAAIWIALGETARRHILLKNAALFERLGQIDRVWFDKTGTLTHNALELVDVQPAPGCPLDPAALVRIGATLERDVPHPVARALHSMIDPNEPLTVATEVRTRPGLGVQGVIAGSCWLAGSTAFITERGGRIDPHTRSRLDAAAASGAVAVILACQSTSGDVPVVQAVLRFAERVRPEAAAAFHQLTALGVSFGVLTGDQAPRPAALRALPECDVRTGLAPQEKASVIAAARHRHGVVAMVGDGLNDAPALAAADIGFALGTGADLTRAAADVSIVAADLTAVPWLIGYGRRVRRIVRQNLAWVFLYNGLALTAAAGGFLNPIIAAFAMVLSSALVVANARRLRGGG